LRGLKGTGEEMKGVDGSFLTRGIDGKTSCRFERILGEDEGLEGGYGGEMRDLNEVVDAMTGAVGKGDGFEGL
jgi:hypothetical protein